MSDTPEKKPDEITEAAQKTMNVLSAEIKTDVPLTEDEKLFGLFGHLAMLGGFVFPFGNILGPLAIYIIKKDESRFVHFHALQSMYFQICVSLTMIALVIVVAIVGFLTAGILLIPLYGLVSLIALLILVYSILTGVKAKEGKWPLYPIVGKMAYDKVMAAPEPVKPVKPAAPATPPAAPPPPSNPA